jgi:SEC-C motif-containing protein
MRSRYTAYVRRDWAYLLATWHPSTRPASVDPGDVTWQGLEVVATEAGGPADSNGTVTFVAHFTSADGMSDAVRETSRFVQTDGRWLYVDETPPQRR